VYTIRLCTTRSLSSCTSVIFSLTTRGNFSHTYRPISVDATEDTARCDDYYRRRRYGCLSTTVEENISRETETTTRAVRPINPVTPRCNNERLRVYFFSNAVLPTTNSNPKLKQTNHFMGFSTGLVFLLVKNTFYMYTEWKSTNNVREKLKRMFKSNSIKM